MAQINQMRCVAHHKAVRPIARTTQQPVMLSSFWPCLRVAVARSASAANECNPRESGSLAHHGWIAAIGTSTNLSLGTPRSQLHPNSGVSCCRAGPSTTPMFILTRGQNKKALAFSTRSLTTGGERLPHKHKAALSSKNIDEVGGISTCDDGGYRHQHSHESEDQEHVLPVSQDIHVRYATRTEDTSIPSSTSFVERCQVIRQLLAEHEWSGVEQNLEDLSIQCLVETAPGCQQIRADLAREGLRSCAARRDVSGAGHLAGKLLRWLYETEDMVPLERDDFLNAIDATSASPSSHQAAEWALKQAVLRGYRPTTGHFLRVFECLAAAENWVGISDVFGMMVDVGKGQVPSTAALKAAMPGLVWQWRPDEVLEISKRTVEWSSMDSEQLSEKGARMLSDLVSTYAAAGNRVPPSSPDSDIHFLPLPVRGLMAVLRLWESWLGEHTFTDKALVEAMSACNWSGHYDGTLALLDAVRRRVPDGWDRAIESHDKKDKSEIVDNGSTGARGEVFSGKGGEGAGGSHRSHRLPPTEVFALALEACAGRVRQKKARSATPLSKQIILLMQGIGVKQDAAVYAGLIACSRSNVAQARAYLRRMQEEGHGYPARAVNAAMRVCINSNELLTALELAKRLPVDDWDGHTVRLMSICHDRKQQTGSLVRLIQRLQERQRNGNPIVLPWAEDYARLAKGAHKAHGQRRKPWEVLELCVSAGLVPSEDLLLTVSEACLDGRLWRRSKECLDISVRAGVGRRCRDKLAQQAYEACAASRMWDELKEVRGLMAEWGIRPDEHTRLHVYAFAKIQAEELEQELRASAARNRCATSRGIASNTASPGNDQHDPATGTEDGGETDTDGGGQRGAMEASAAAKEIGTASDGTARKTSLGSISLQSSGIEGRGISSGNTSAGEMPRDGKAVAGARETRGGVNATWGKKKWRPSAIPDDPLGPLSPPESWWEGEAPSEWSVEGQARSRDRWGLHEAVRWLDDRFRGGEEGSHSGKAVDLEGRPDSRLSVERWSHFIADRNPGNPKGHGERPRASREDGQSDDGLPGVSESS